MEDLEVGADGETKGLLNPWVRTSEPSAECAAQRNTVQIALVMTALLALLNVTSSAAAFYFHTYTQGSCNLGPDVEPQTSINGGVMTITCIYPHATVTTPKGSQHETRYYAPQFDQPRASKIVCPVNATVPCYYWPRDLTVSLPESDAKQETLGYTIVGAVQACLALLVLHPLLVYPRVRRRMQSVVEPALDSISEDSPLGEGWLWSGDGCFTTGGFLRPCLLLMGAGASLAAAFLEWPTVPMVLTAAMFLCQPFVVLTTFPSTWLHISPGEFEIVIERWGMNLRRKQGQRTQPWGELRDVFYVKQPGGRFITTEDSDGIREAVHLHGYAKKFWRKCAQVRTGITLHRKGVVPKSARAAPTTEAL